MSNNPTNESEKLTNELNLLKKQNAELSQAGFELINAQTKLHSLLHNASDGIITFSANGTVESFNIAAQHIFGYSEGEIINRKIPHLIPCPDWVKENVGAYIRYFISSRASRDIPLLGKHRMGFDILLSVSTGQASGQDVTLFDDSNEIKSFEEEAAPFDDFEDKTAIGDEKSSIVCFFRDITLNKKLEKELEDHKHALDLAAGVIMLDKDFRVIDINDNFCQMLGKNRTEFIGEQYIQSNFDGAPGNEHNLKRRREFLLQGTPWQGETCFFNKQGEQTWFTESTTPFLDELNVPYQYLSILINITDRKHFEVQLQQHGDNLQDLVDEQIKDIRLAKDLAESANKAKSEFLANMSHELRTPMHAIISFTHLSLKQFQTKPLTQKQTDKLHKFLSNIESSSQRLLLLLNNLLDLSKLESGKEELDLKHNDLYQLSQQVGEEFSAKIEEKKLELILEKPSSPMLVLCDTNKILQVLSNLIANAIKFSPKSKKILITIENTNVILGKRASDTQQTNGILLSITDQGLGIPDDELTSIFDKFIQSSKTKSGAGGTGLGLSISQEIISAHKGKIWAEHNPEGGAVFKLFLPGK